MYPRASTVSRSTVLLGLAFLASFAYVNHSLPWRCSYSLPWFPEPTFLPRVLLYDLNSTLHLFSRLIILKVNVYMGANFRSIWGNLLHSGFRGGKTSGWSVRGNMSGGISPGKMFYTAASSLTIIAKTASRSNTIASSA